MKLNKGTIIFLILIGMFISSFFIKQKIILIALGIIFVFIGVWLIKGLALELAFFGAIFGIVEAIKYWGTPVLGLTSLPESVYIFTAAFIITWIILRLIYVTALFIPVLAPVNAFLHKPIW